MRVSLGEDKVKGDKIVHCNHKSKRSLIFGQNNVFAQCSKESNL